MLKHLRLYGRRQRCALQGRASSAAAVIQTNRPLTRRVAAFLFSARRSSAGLFCARAGPETLKALAPVAPPSLAASGRARFSATRRTVHRNPCVPIVLEAGPDAPPQP